MLSALVTDEAREVLHSFLMSNRPYPLYLVTEDWANASDCPI